MLFVCVHQTNATAVKGQFTSHQTRGCQLSRQIRVYLNLELKICLKILSDQVLWLQQDLNYSKVRTHYCKHQYTTSPSSEWQLDTGFLRTAPAANNSQHSMGNRRVPHWWQLTADAAHPLPFHTSAPKTPCCQPPSTFSLRHSCASPGLLHHACFLTPVLLHQKPHDREGGRMTNSSTLLWNAMPGWRVAFPWGRA